MRRAALARRLALAVVAALAPLASCSQGSLPAADFPRANAATPVEAEIEAHEVCIGSTVESVGRLADVLFYTHRELKDGRVAVGYYAFFSEERPWGNNWLTWLVLPALTVDLVYTRALLVAPGYQRLAYGKGDVEGVRVVYRRGPEGLEFDYAVADDASHEERLISREEAYGVEPERMNFYTESWSHQLGGSGVRHTDDLAFRRCYARDRLIPLPDKVRREFDLARRAKPASLDPALAQVARDDLRGAPPGPALAAEAAAPGPNRAAFLSKGPRGLRGASASSVAASKPEGGELATGLARVERNERLEGIEGLAPREAISPSGGSPPPSRTGTGGTIQALER